MRVTEERLRTLRANNEESHLEARDCIKSALVALLEQKPYRDISMTEIIQKSGISRAGVYKNYKNKDEIMLALYREPIDEFLSAMSTSVFENMEAIFRIGKKHEKALKSIIDAGLEHNILRMMNERFENVAVSFYIPLWIGMIFNSFIEWARAGTDESVDAAVERIHSGLRLVAASIETGLTNLSQNQMIS